MTRDLSQPHSLEYVLVERGRSHQMKTISDLQWFLYRCIDAKYEDGGKKSCIGVTWKCSTTTEAETRQAVQFVKEKLRHRVQIDALVIERREGKPSVIKFINTTRQCKSCEHKIDCLDAERL